MGGISEYRVEPRFALAQWNVQVAEACNDPDPKTTAARAIEATRSLLEYAASDRGDLCDQPAAMRSGAIGETEIGERRQLEQLVTQQPGREEE